MDTISEQANSRLRLDGVDAVIVDPGRMDSTIRLLKQCREYNIITAVLKTGNKAGETLPKEMEELADHSFILNAEEQGKTKNQPGKLIRQLADDHGISVGKIVFISPDPMLINQVRKVRLALRLGISDGTRGNVVPGKKVFYQNGANLVHERLEEVIISGNDLQSTAITQEIPSLFGTISKFQLPFQGRKPVFFFDYDGTLTPIVKDPAKAIISDSTRTLLRQLADRSTVAIVSGRDLNTIRDFIQLENIIYAGSHGFRISGPNGLSLENEQAKKLLPGLDELESRLQRNLEKKIKGVEVERKHFAIAVHYRNAPPRTYQQVKKEIDELLSGNKDFKKGPGKKIVEIKPSIDWHKGRAVEWILDNLGLANPREYIPVYAGDDVTDEDAFRSLVDHGIGILVGKHGQPSAAHFHLNSSGEIEKFLHFLVHSSDPYSSYR